MPDGEVAVEVVLRADHACRGHLGGGRGSRPLRGLRCARIGNEMETVSLRTQAKWGLGTLVAWMILGLFGLGDVALVVVTFAAVWGVWDFAKRLVLRGHAIKTGTAPPVHQR